MAGVVEPSDEPIRSFRTKALPETPSFRLAHSLLAASPENREIAMRIARLIVGSLALALAANTV